MPGPFIPLLPGNATPALRLLDELAHRRHDPLDADLIRVAKSISSAPVDYLAHLAYEESADIWSSAWDAARQRSFAAAQWSIHRRKGTVRSVQDAQDALGYGSQVREWFTIGGQPYTFRLDIDLDSRPQGWLVADYDLMVETAIETKPNRAHLSGILAKKTGTVPVGVGLAHSLIMTVEHRF